MSRVGKKPVQLPDGIEADIVASQITIKGQKGQLNQTFPESVKLEKEDDKIRPQAHSDYVYDKINTYGNKIDIMIEAKRKELAVAKYLELHG